jgi:hypothetical protein
VLIIENNLEVNTEQKDLNNQQNYYLIIIRNEKE